MKKLFAILIILALLLSSVSYMATAADKPTLSDLNGHWSKDTVNWAIEKGFVTGYPDGTFKPNNHVTEEEFLAMIVRAYHPEIGVAEGKWAENYYDFAEQHKYPVKGIMWRGPDGKKSEPLAGGKIEIQRHQIIDRQFVAELIAATQGFNYTGDDAIRFVLGNKLAKGNNPYKVTMLSYNKYGKLSRAEAVQFVKNLLENGNEELATREEKQSDTSILPDIPYGGMKIGDVEIIKMGYPDGRSEKPADPKLVDLMKEWIKSVKIDTSTKTVTFTVPKKSIKGYVPVVNYMDMGWKSGDVRSEYDVLFHNNVELGKTYSFKYVRDDDGFLDLSYRYDDGFWGGAINFWVHIPSMKGESVFGGW